MPQITIDGKLADFSAGESILGVAEREGIEIPHFCWHKDLSVAANCRMCMVEVEKAPKLMPACQVECREGMVAYTQSDRVREAQRAVMEFLLVNHPIDCPICDQAGECKLQDYYMKYDSVASRMADRKVHKPRLQRFGPHVLYNAERCILCTRCVRFMDEVAGERSIGIVNRGDHAEIGIFPGHELRSPYSLNIVDICPVGALTSTAFRFKQRVWFLDRSPGVCVGCARGCNTFVEHRASQVYRLLPRENAEVNGCWMCDDGRLTYNRANRDRLTEATVRETVEAAAAPKAPGAGRSGSEAALHAAKMLAAAIENGAGVAVVISATATCEEAYVLGRLARDVLSAAPVAVLGNADGESDDKLRVADKNPNRAGVERILRGMEVAVQDRAALLASLREGQIGGLLVVGHEIGDISELLTSAPSIATLVHLASVRTPLCDVAHVVLPSASWAEVDGTWINSEGRAQRLQPAFLPTPPAKPHHEWLMEMSAGLGVLLPLPSEETIRFEIESTVRGFCPGDLSEVGPYGRALDATDQGEETEAQSA